jgi:hypothetical protein
MERIHRSDRGLDGAWNAFEIFRCDDGTFGLLLQNHWDADGMANAAFFNTRQEARR